MHVVIVVPCFNEEARLDPSRFLEFAARGFHVTFVNDGSTDRTQEVLEQLASTSGHISLLRLSRNVGKAEAVRQGLLVALESGAKLVGYFDADLATPPAEMIRLIELLAESNAQMAMGSRVVLLGRDVRRSARRHYLGRIFATLASMSLNIAVYDTQCGAKCLRVTPKLKAALATPFVSKWIFDVELIGRLVSLGLGPDAFLEVPLQSWHDVKGSKLSPTAMLRSLGELATIARSVRRGVSTRHVQPRGR